MRMDVELYCFAAECFAISAISEREKPLKPPAITIQYGYIEDSNKAFI